MTADELNKAVAAWKKLIGVLREVFDALAQAFAMLGYIISEVYDRYKMSMRRYKRKIRKMYRHKRRRRW